MTIVHLLEKNAREFPNDVALVEINPEQPETRRITWIEFELVEPGARRPYRREITWGVFEEKANRFANMLTQNGIGKGHKVAILLMNCIDWLPIYFGILKTGALVVPLNFRYSSDEIDYCLDLAEADVLVFGNEFVGRVEAVADKSEKNLNLFILAEVVLPLQTIIMSLFLNVQVHTMVVGLKNPMMLRFISHQVQQASQKQFYIITKV